MLEPLLRIILFWYDIHCSSNCWTSDEKDYNSCDELLLKLFMYYALQNTSLTTDICHEESKIGEQMFALHYWFLVSFSFMPWIAVIFFAVKSIVE